MMRFEKNIDDRKKLVRRLEELTGETSVYTFVPRCAYEVGPYTVEKNGTLTVEENAADRDILNTLLYEQMIVGELPEEAAETETEEAEAEETAPEEETEPAEEPQEPEPEEPEQEEPEPQEPEDEEADDEPEDSGEDDEEDELLEIGQEEPDCLNISFPASEHTGNSLRNLIHLVYSRGPMINKAVGTHFHVDKELIEALADDRCTYSPISLRMAVANYEREHSLGTAGIRITDDEVTLMGFPLTDDPDRTRACTELVTLMNKMAIKQKRIQAKEIDAENEKYAFRIWLLRLGMNGAEYKQTRKLLMENLDGNSAFRTEEDAEKFKAKEKEKRDALKAAKAAEGENTALEEMNAQNGGEDDE